MNELLKIEEKCNLNPFIKERGSASKASIEEARRSDPCYIYTLKWVCEKFKAPISSRGTKKSQFRSYRQRKAKNAPKTKKGQQTALSRKKASLHHPRTKNYKKRHFARKNTNKKHLQDYTRGTNYI